MASVVGFTFNPFQENTYLVIDEGGDCVIFDPGCIEAHEKKQISNYIEQHQLNLVRLINTHCHLDHVFGNHFISSTYDLPLEIHEGELSVLKATPQVCAMYGIAYPEPSPMPGRYIEEGDVIEFGSTQLRSIFTPGHSPASLSFYCEADAFVIAGDVLFYNSIGRTDLPGGDFNTLIKSIKNKLFPLGDEVKIYPGHGQATTIGFEKMNNPYLQE